ncbi:hypothetical protein [Microbulbifer sp. THAF38]|uniref:hypothetical protein n=1 Tax=Microbulbifer sp. THAF38 TaxID=2587856 RepID=UPI001267E07A|nr:hypothetical protein [Microbulbifer sp. THAF38]
MTYIVNSLALSIFFSTSLVNAEQGKGQYLGAFNDPVRYCRAVKNADRPQEPYIGPAKPQMVLSGIRKAAGIAEDAPEDWVAGGTFWRCMDGAVYACFVGANLPCTEKADISREPSEAMTTYCESNPRADAIPAAVTGRATVFEWRCKNTEPEVVRQILHEDARGYLAEYWYRLDGAE